MRALFACNSWLAIVMITDFLGRKERFNTPGMAVPTNWARRLRLSVSQLQNNRAVRSRARIVRQILQETRRSPSEAA